MLNTSIHCSATWYFQGMNEDGLPPPTFGEWLEDQLKERGWSRPRLARMIDYSPGAVTSWIRGDRTPEERACVMIAEVFGISANEVLRRAGRPELPDPEILVDAGTKIPLPDTSDPWEHLDQRLRRIEIQIGESLPKVEVIGRVPADGVRWAAIGDVYTVEVTRARLGNARAPFGLEVTGECFRSVGIYSGDVVIVDPPMGRVPQDRQIVVVRVGDDVTLKRWCVVGDAIELRDGDERVVYRLSDGDDFEVQGLYVTHEPFAPR